MFKSLLSMIAMRRVDINLEPCRAHEEAAIRAMKLNVRSLARRERSALKDPILMSASGL